MKTTLHQCLQHLPIRTAPAPPKVCTATRHRPAPISTARWQLPCCAQAQDSGTPQAAAMSKTALRALKKDQLASMLRELHLSIDGLKPELVDRLYDALQQAPQPPAESADVHADDGARPAQAAAAPPAADPIAIDAGTPADARAHGHQGQPAVAPANTQQQHTASEPQPSQLPPASATTLPLSRRGGEDAATEFSSEDAQPATAGGTASAASTAAAAGQNAAVGNSLPNSAPHVRQRQQPAAEPHPAASQPLPPPQCYVPTGLAVQWLGTSSGAPTQHRNVSSILLLQQRRVFMVDCGEGTRNQLAKAQLDPLLVKRIFITHMHGDHIFGLPGMLRAISERHKSLDGAARDTVHIFGPPGLEELLCTSLQATMTELAMPVVITEFSVDPAAHQQPEERFPGMSCATMSPSVQPPQQLSDLLRDWEAGEFNTMKRLAAGERNHPLGTLAWNIDCGGGISVTAAPLSHRLPCWGYVFQEATQFVGADPAKVQALVRQGADEQKVLRRVRERQAVTLPSGEAVPPEQLAVVRPGRRVVLLGDTCNSTALTGAGMGADVLSHEATFSNEEEHKAGIAMHSTAGMAGAFARRLRAKRVVLTHFSGRYKMGGASLRNLCEAGDVPEFNSNSQAYLAQQAQAAIGRVPGAPQVSYAQDLFVLNVPCRQVQPAVPSVPAGKTLTAASS